MDIKNTRLGKYRKWCWETSIGNLIPDNFLTIDSSKIKEHENYVNVIHYMAPHFLAGNGHNVCPNSNNECRNSCLGWKSGQFGMVLNGDNFRMNNQRASLIRKSVLFARDKELYTSLLISEINFHRLKSIAKGKKLALRLDGSSGLLDYWYNVKGIHKMFPDVIFYEYTKSLKIAVEGIDGVDLTFSHKTSSSLETQVALDNGVRVAVAFNGNKKQVKNLKTWKGYKVENGDEHDYRFLNSKGVIIGLSLKGITKKSMDMKFFEEIA